MEERAASRTAFEKSGETTPGKPDQRKQAKPMLCSRATRSSRFRESFINRRNVGKPSLKRTKRIFAIQKTSPSVRRWLFRNKPCSRDRIPDRSLDLASHSRSDQLALPGNQQGRCPRRISCNSLESTARCNERSLQSKLLGRFVAPFAQLIGALTHFGGRPRTGAAAHNRPIRLRRFQRNFCCFAERLPPSSGKVFVIRHVTRSETFRRVQ